MLSFRGVRWSAMLAPFTLLLSGASVLSCDRASDRSHMLVRDSAGVEIAENRAEDRALPIVAYLIGDLVPPDSALTAVPWGVAADPMSGRIFVADWEGSRVAVFDRAGTFVGNFGREGDGPGEFRSPSAVAIDPHGSLAVWDTGKGMISRWSSEGDLLNEHRPELSYWGPGFSIGRDRIVAVTSEAESGGMDLRQRLVSWSSRGIETIYELTLEQVMMELPCISMPAPKVFAPLLLWAGSPDTLHVLNGPNYRIDIHVDEKLTRSIRRDVQPISVTHAMAVERVEIGPYADFMESCGVRADDIVKAVGYEEVIPPVLGIATDQQGRLWVTRTSDGLRAGAVDVFARNGGYEGTLDGVGMPVAFLSDTLLVSIRQRETGLRIVSLYEIRPEASDSMSPEGTRADYVSGDETSGSNEFRDCSVCPVMVEIPPGRFLMGSPDGEEPAAANPNRPEWTELAEKPRIPVEIAYPFAAGKYEVTFVEWDHCVDAGGCTYRPGDEGWGRGKRPVINVSRDDALEYVGWLSELSGRPYRLLSEAEWEYAARAGTETARYWGDSLGNAMAVCDGCGSRYDDRSTAPVGSLPVNPFGLHDMLGNVEEWVADCWTTTHDGAPGDGSPRLEESPWWKDGECERPMQRGGAWSYYPWTVRAASRSYWRPGPWSDREPTYGFRVARPVDYSNGPRDTVSR